VKKLLFIAQLPPPVHGASLRNESLAKSELLNKNFDVDIYPLRYSNKLNEIECFSCGKIVRAIKDLVNIIWKVYKDKPDIAYYTFSPDGFALWRDCLFVTVIKALKANTVLHFRNCGVKRNSRCLRKKLIYKFTWKNTNIITLSKLHAEEFREVFNGNTFILHNGIKENVSTGDIINGKPLEDKPHFLFLSNLFQRKGYIDFIDSLSLLKGEIKFDASIAGAFVDVIESELAKYIEQKGLKGLIRILGPLNRSEVFKELLNCNIFVFASYDPKEIFPGAILEAMQCGRAIISTEIGSTPDIINTGYNGILVPPNNIPELKSAMLYLALNSDVRSTIGKNARASFLEKYTFDKFERGFVSILSSVCQKDINKRRI
jgi:glycosyltransferase involved in cell wall biosynthesis